MSNISPQASQGGHGGHGGHGTEDDVFFGTDAPLVADALINNRDGIVGNFRRPEAVPQELDLDDVANMTRWAQERREQVVDFELHSRIGFSQGMGDPAGSMNVWHLEVAHDPDDAVPNVRYRPLVRMVRPTEKVFLGQLQLVANYADLRADRVTEILAQRDGPTAFLASVAYMAPNRARWTLELLGAVFRLAQFVEFRMKHALACRRPMEYSPQIQPMILTPEHGSLPSGHSTESFAMAIVLVQLLRASPNPVYEQDIYAVQLLRQAARVAVNRQVAGVHFPVDSAAGALLGLTLGEYFCRRFSGEADFYAWSFDGEAYPEDADFNWAGWYDVQRQRQIAPDARSPCAAELGRHKLGAVSPILTWLWEKALAEWS
ncbi:phosphatase PAP2 family protein [Rhizobium sp. BR 317]|uniref:phosphatase PAP2 family protein n=1 Tax=Rhizobium sp. BR 317 TaxID=3040015 RepID=UPI0039BFF27A